jgi:hypothetical protein
VTTDLHDEAIERVCIALEHDWPTWHGHRFASRFDRVGEPASFDALDLVRLVLDPMVGESKDRLPLWGPTVYGPPWTERGRLVCRRADNTCSVGMVVLDVDDGTPIDELLVGDVFAIAHTSWSHTEEVPKWRVVMPLAEPVPAQDWPEVWRGVAHRWPCVDPATKDPSRMYYVPAVRQSKPLCQGPKRLAYRRGTYQARVQLGPWLTPPKAPPPPPRAAPPRPTGMVPVAMLSEGTRGRYAAAILRRRVERVATAGKGQRNTQLFAAAVDAKRLALAGVVGWGDAVAQLEGAAGLVGLGGREVSQTIASAERRADGLGAWDEWG